MAAAADLGSRTELDRRYANVRTAMAEHALDGLIVAGSEYSGFEGAVTYLSGFQIVHRYAYVVVPADGDPFVVFPAEARYVGEHGTGSDRAALRPASRQRDRRPRARRRLAQDRRLRPRLRDDGAGLPPARELRDRPVRRRVRPGAFGQERGRARERRRTRCASIAAASRSGRRPMRPGGRPPRSWPSPRSTSSPRGAAA